MNPNENSGAQEAPKKNKVFPIILSILVLGGGTFGFIKYNHSQHHEETDDAQIENNVSPVIPRIAGYVLEVRVKDNQMVKKGDTLLILDNRSETIQVQQAEAALASAENNLHVAEANTSASKASISSTQASVATIDAQIEAAKITLRRATQDYERYQNLIKDRTITQQQFEQAEAAKQSAEKQLTVLSEQKVAASRQVNTVTAQSNATGQSVGVANASIQQKKADVENAKLNLSYTVIVAQADGQLSKINVQTGQLVQPGQQLFSIIGSETPWVVGNFKETQLSRIKIGQKVTIHVDAFPGKEFNAKVTSLSPATGARFALLPPDNASGNFVKTVQRLPIRIEFDAADEAVKSLKAGMNADVDVHLD